MLSEFAENWRKLVVDKSMATCYNITVNSKAFWQQKFYANSAPLLCNHGVQKINANTLATTSANTNMQGVWRLEISGQTLPFAGYFVLNR